MNEEEDEDEEEVEEEEEEEEEKEEEEEEEEEGEEEEQEEVEKMLTYLCKLTDDKSEKMLDGSTKKQANQPSSRPTDQLTSQSSNKQTTEWKNSIHNLVNTFNTRNFDLLTFSNDNGNTSHMAIVSGATLLKNYKKTHVKCFLCRFCNNSFKLINSFYYHISECQGNLNYCYTVLPRKIKNKLTRKWEAPVYKSRKRGNYLNLYGACWDTETLCAEQDSNLCRLDIACAFAYVFLVLPSNPDEPRVVREIKNTVFPATPFTGPGCMERMLKQLFENAKTARDRTRQVCEYYSKYCISDELLQIKRETQHCQECGLFFEKEADKNVQHSHLLGAAYEMPSGETKIYGSIENIICYKCNLKLSIFNNIFITWAHNFSSFDSKKAVLAISNSMLHEKPLVRKIKILAKNSEKITSLDLYPFCETHYDYVRGEVKLKKGAVCRCFPVVGMRDSLGFLSNKSLDSVTQLLREEGTLFAKGQDVFTNGQNSNQPERNIESTFPICVEYYNRVGLSPYLSVDKLCKKLFYPYNCFTDFSFLKRTEFPKIHEWHDDMKQTQISQSQYDEAYSIYLALGQWAKRHNFECNMGVFTKVYCITDVLNLCSVLREYILGYFQCYRINITQFVTPAAASYECYLKSIEKHKIQLITCPLTYSIFKLGISGGLCDSSIKYFQSNHPVTGSFNPDVLIKQIYAIDAVQFYPTQMALNSLGCGEYRLWSSVECQNLHEKMIKLGIYNSWTDSHCFTKKINGDTVPYGLTLVVVLECGKELHSTLNSFPPFSEKKLIDIKDLGPRQQRFLKGQTSGKVLRLVQSLGPVAQQVLDWRFLKFMIYLGIKVLSVKHVVEYKVSYFARDFFETNARHRSQSNNKIIQSIFKNCSSHVFGKSCQDETKFVNCSLICKKNQLKNLVKKDQFKQLIEISKNCYLGLSTKKRVKLTSNVQIAFTCLNLSKLTLMKKFYTLRHTLYYNYNMISIRAYFDTDSMTNIVYHLNGVPGDQRRDILCFLGNEPQSAQFPYLLPFHRFLRRRSIETSDVHSALRAELKDELDTSELRVTHPHFAHVNASELQLLRNLQIRNKKRLSCWSYDTNHPIASFVSLRAKTYAFQLYNKDSQTNVDKLRCKGIKLKQLNFSHSTYKDFLFNNDVRKYVKQTIIFSKKQILYKKILQKICFSGGDCKRYVLGNVGPWQTLAHGSCFIPLVKEVEIILVKIIDVICASQL